MTDEGGDQPEQVTYNKHNATCIIQTWENNDVSVEWKNQKPGSMQSKNYADVEQN